jgi:hypothetical protein
MLCSLMYNGYILLIHTIMNTLVRFTTNIDPLIMDFIISESQSLKTTKRNIIENALKMYAKNLKKQKLLNAYNAFAKDTDEMQEWLEIANNEKNL